MTTKSARSRARGRGRASLSLEKAMASLAAAEKAKTCTARTENALRAIEHATHAACEASGFRSGHLLGTALNVKTEANRLARSCARRGRLKAGT